MVITTLGTSHGDHTYCRFNSSTLFEIKGRSYLVDAGEPVCALMVRAGKDFDRLKAVFVTHMHGDHVDGLPRLIRRLLKYPHDGKRTEVFLPEERAVPGLNAWLHGTHAKWPSDAVTVDAIGPGEVFDDGVLRVAAEATRHLRDPDRPDRPLSLAYILEGEGKRIVYTGDLSADFSDFPRAARDERCDLCICEVTHYQPEIALPVLAGSPIRRLILNHVHDPWHGDGERRLREMMAELPYPVEIAHDGDVFEV